MLEKEKAIDAVLIATPDHLHAYVVDPRDEGRQARLLREAPDAQRLGGAAVARVAAETGVATQMGNQGRSSEGTARRPSGSGTGRSAPSARSTPGTGPPPPSA